MTDRRRFLRVFVVLAVFGLGNLVRMIGKPGFETIRPLDAVQLIGTGMCLGGAILALVFFTCGALVRADARQPPADFRCVI